MQLDGQDVRSRSIPRTRSERARHAFRPTGCRRMRIAYVTVSTHTVHTAYARCLSCLLPKNPPKSWEVTRRVRAMRVRCYTRARTLLPKLGPTHKPLDQSDEGTHQPGRMKTNHPTMTATRGCPRQTRAMRLTRKQVAIQKRPRWCLASCVASHPPLFQSRRQQ